MIEPLLEQPRHPQWRRLGRSCREKSIVEKLRVFQRTLGDTHIGDDILARLFEA